MAYTEVKTTPIKVDTRRNLKQYSLESEMEYCDIYSAGITAFVYKIRIVTIRVHSA